MAILHLRLAHPAPELYRQAFDALGDISPLVQALPPDAALVDVTGATRYFRRTPEQLADLLHTRLLARYGLTASIGAGPTRMIAAMAAARCRPGDSLVVDDEQAPAFLARQPVRALPDASPALARTLAAYGLTTVADLRDLPADTLARIVGAVLGRTLHEQARGVDRRRVVPGGPPASIAVTCAFPRDTLDPALAYRALLDLAVELGDRLRSSRQVTRSLELQVRYADRHTTTRTRTLREATGHTPALRDLLYQAFGSLGLQRARIRALTARAHGIGPAGAASAQLTLDRATENLRALEPAIDRLNRRFGPGTVRPAPLPPSTTRDLLHAVPAPAGGGLVV